LESPKEPMMPGTPLTPKPRTESALDEEERGATPVPLAVKAKVAAKARQIWVEKITPIVGKVGTWVKSSDGTYPRYYVVSSSRVPRVVCEHASPLGWLGFVLNETRQKWELEWHQCSDPRLYPRMEIGEPEIIKKLQREW
jgi:hypothetical protein